MRLKLAGVALTFVVSFSLAACNDRSDGDSPANVSPQQVEFDFDFDAKTKTKTVTVPPATLPPPPYRPATTTKRPIQMTATTKPTRR